LPTFAVPNAAIADAQFAHASQHAGAPPPMHMPARAAFIRFAAQKTSPTGYADMPHTVALTTSVVLLPLFYEAPSPDAIGPTASARRYAPVFFRELSTSRWQRGGGQRSMRAPPYISPGKMPPPR